MKRYLLLIFWVFAVLLLLFFSTRYKDSSSAILAEVEPQKHAISFQKAIRVEEIYVVPGQHVKKGDPLIKVERPDLRLDSDKLENELLSLENEKRIKEIERENKLSVLKLNYETRSAKIGVEIDQIKILLSDKTQLSQNLERLHLIPDSLAQMDQTYLKLRLESINVEKQNIMRQYEIESREVEQVSKLDIETIVNKIDQVEKELGLLRQEESELIQYSGIDGTIGNISSEEGELAPPYNTLLTLYEDNPTIIRALMGEQQNVEVKSGDEVVVESTNRKYKIKGRVLEVGSRVIEYPSRLRTFREVPMWGRELFIKIPDESRFLNGEKVFVILKKE